MATFGSTYIPKSGDWILVKPNVKGGTGNPTDRPHVYQVTTTPTAPQTAFKARRLDSTDVVGRCMVLYETDYSKWTQTGQPPHRKAWDQSLPLFWSVKYATRDFELSNKGKEAWGQLVAVEYQKPLTAEDVTKRARDLEDGREAYKRAKGTHSQTSLALNSTIANFYPSGRETGQHSLLNDIYRVYRLATPGENGRISPGELLKIIQSHYPHGPVLAVGGDFIFGLKLRPVKLDIALVTWVRDTYTASDGHTSLKQILLDARTVAPFASLAREDLRDTLLAAFEPSPKTVAPKAGESLSHMLVGVKRKIPLAPLERAPTFAAPAKVPANDPSRAPPSKLLAQALASSRHSFDVTPPFTSSSKAPYLQSSYIAQSGRPVPSKPHSAPAPASVVPASLATASSSSDKGKQRASLSSDSGYATSSPSHPTPLNLQTLPHAAFIEYMKTADPARARLYDAARVILDEEAIGSDVLLRVGQDKLEKLGIKIGVASRMLMELSVVG
ncbi:hypothetical protein RQP46_001908 [Phenoliferia psychrophenolica]